MVALVTKSLWNGKPPKVRPRNLSRAFQRGLAVHHTGTPEDRQEHHYECAKRVQAIQRYHQVGKGWNDIAYNWLACHHGYLFEGRGVGIRSAGQGTVAGNTCWHAVCILGSGAGFSAASEPGLVVALVDAIDRTRAYGKGANRVWPHLRFHSTECPGKGLRQWCRQWP